jgi:lambda family phage tail tape measure protein
MQMKAEMLGIGTQAAPMISTLQKMGVDGEHSFAQLIQSGGVFREVLVLMHESLIMGNWSRFGGSLMVIAERMNMTEWAFGALGLAALGTTAAIGGVIAAMVLGANESAKFAEAMVLTGGMAGITEGQFNAMAESIGSQIPGSVLKARNALQDLVSTGQFTGDTLAAMGRAAVLFSQYSGQSAEDVVKDFAGMKDGVAKWAEKENESYHFLTAAQYEYIQTLEQQGQTEAAEKVVADDMYNHLRETGTQNLGILQRAWQDLGDTIRGTWDLMESVGRASTLEEQLAARIQQDRRGNNRFGLGTIDPETDPEVINLRRQIAQQQQQGAARAHQDQVQQLGITAHDDLHGFLPPEDEVKAQVAKLKLDVAQALAANPNDPVALNLQAHMQDAIARIQKRYGHEKTDRFNAPDKNGFVIGSDDTGKLQTQLSMMQEYARATKQTETAVLNLEIAQGKLKGFTPAQISELRGRAQRDDATAQAANATQLQGRYTNKLTGFQGRNAELQAQLQQMQEYGKVTKETQIDMVNLEIAQGNLKGLPQSEIDSLRAAATEQDKLSSQIAAWSKTSMGGTQSAFQGYVDQATNAGKQVHKVWNDTFTGMEDLLVSSLEGGKVSFDKFALSVVNDLLKMEVEKNIMGPLVSALGGLGGGKNGSGIVKAIGSFVGGLKFADGGIMTSAGALPLNRYANGGVANTPQLAMFGEGRGPEAYVPLPDGRSIPVSMKSGGGGVQNNVTNHITINSDGSSQVTAQDANRASQGLTYAIQQELIRQHRDGGIFSQSSTMS